MTPRARNKKDNGRVFLSNKPCLCLVLWGWVGFSSDTSSKLMWAQSRDAAGQHSSPSLFGRVKLFFLVLSFVQLWLTGRQTHQTSQPERMNGHRAGRGNTQQPWQAVVLRHDKRPGPHSTGSHSTHCLDNKRTHTHTTEPSDPTGFSGSALVVLRVQWHGNNRTEKRKYSRGYIWTRQQNRLRSVLLLFFI